MPKSSSWMEKTIQTLTDMIIQTCRTNHKWTIWHFYWKGKAQFTLLKCNAQIWEIIHGVHRPVDLLWRSTRWLLQAKSGVWGLRKLSKGKASKRMLQVRERVIGVVWPFICLTANILRGRNIWHFQSNQAPEDPKDKRSLKRKGNQKWQS